MNTPLKRCPLTYAALGDSLSAYSLKGLHKLSPRLSRLKPLPYTTAELHKEALKRGTQWCIPSVQLSVDAHLNITHETFELRPKHGPFILKLPSDLWPELPANEDLTMHLAKAVGIEVPSHGLIYDSDDALIYFIKRFDHASGRKKQAQEDLTKIRPTNYQNNLENVIKIIDKTATFPALERLKLWERTLFCFLVGNEDIHLKNLSFVRHQEKVTLSPAYDLYNKALVLEEKAQGELILSLRGKHTQLTRDDFISYLAKECLGLSKKMIDKTLDCFGEILPQWRILIHTSFLSTESQRRYSELVQQRYYRLFG